MELEPYLGWIGVILLLIFYTIVILIVFRFRFGKNQSQILRHISRTCLLFLITLILLYLFVLGPLLGSYFYYHRNPLNRYPTEYIYADIIIINIYTILFVFLGLFYYVRAINDSNNKNGSSKK